MVWGRKCSCLEEVAISSQGLASWSRCVLPKPLRRLTGSARSKVQEDGEETEGLA